MYLQVREVFYQPCKGNTEAHLLAQFGLRQQRLFWSRLAPHWLWPTLVANKEEILSFAGGMWYFFSLTEFSSTGGFHGKVLMMPPYVHLISPVFLGVLLYVILIVTKSNEDFSFDKKRTSLTFLSNQVRSIFFNFII